MTGRRASLPAADVAVDVPLVAPTRLCLLALDGDAGGRVLVMSSEDRSDVKDLVQASYCAGPAVVVVSEAHAAVCRFPASDGACWSCTATQLSMAQAPVPQLLPLLLVQAGALAIGAEATASRWQLRPQPGALGSAALSLQPVRGLIRCPHTAGDGRLAEQLVLLP